MLTITKANILFYFRHTRRLVSAELAFKCYTNEVIPTETTNERYYDRFLTLFTNLKKKGFIQEVEEGKYKTVKWPLKVVKKLFPAA